MWDADTDDHGGWIVVSRGVPAYARVHSGGLADSRPALQLEELRRWLVGGD